MTAYAKKGERPPNAKSPLVQIDEIDQEDMRFPYLDRAADPALVSQGWQRRFMVAPDRIKETSQIYKDLGYEVHQAPIKPVEFDEICKSCQTLACDDYVTIYTRKKE